MMRTSKCAGYGFLRNRHTAKALTFIELAIVTAMLGVIALSLYGVCSNAVKIWQRVRQPFSTQDVNIFLDRFTADVRNACKYSEFPLAGREDSFELFAVTYSRRLGVSTVSKVAYTFDRADAIFKRTALDYSAFYTEEQDDNASIIQHIPSLKFSYYYFNKEKNEYLWRDEWNEVGFPRAIRAEFNYDDGKDTGTFITTVTIPVGG